MSAFDPKRKCMNNEFGSPIKRRSDEVDRTALPNEDNMILAGLDDVITVISK